MNKLILLVCSTCLVSFSAYAEGTTTTESHTPKSSWEGLYVGGSLGVVHDRTSFYSNNSYNGSTNGGGKNVLASDHGIAGLQLGYNWLFDSYLVGLTSDVNFGSFKQTACRGAATTSTACGDSLNGTMDMENDTKLLGTVRAKAGYVFGDFVPYVTTGVALARLTNTTTIDCPSGCGVNDNIPGFNTATNRNTALRLTYGIGGEYRLAQNWRVGGEFMYLRFPSQSVSFTHNATFGPQVITSSQPSTYNAFKVNLIYTFD